MNWKVFLTACVSVAFTAFPQNMIGCAGGEPDAYDYFTTFFNKKTSTVNGYKPFYYTSLLTFYDDQSYEPSFTYNDDRVLQEWVKHSGKNISSTEAADFIYSTNNVDAENILSHITQNKTLQLPDSTRKNGMIQYFLDTKDSTALTYLVFAKDIEKFCASGGDWDTKPQRDSLSINRYIEQANKLYLKNKVEFLKNKYAFQLCKLAFYNNRFTDCIKWCDEYFTADNTSAVKSLAVSYKAGSYYRLGKKAEAAYSFSNAFIADPFNRRKIFLGFLWATDQCNKDLEEEYSALCKSNEEKATMLGMFGLYGTSYKLNTIRKVYALNPSASILEILTIREINKLEEQYLTPQLDHLKGGKAYYDNAWYGSVEDSATSAVQLVKTVSFFEKMASDNRVSNRGLYYAGAAYIAFMNKDYAKTKQLLAAAKTTKLSDKVNDQLQLINLLTTINENSVITPAFENTILPSIKWLEQKAKKEDEYKFFYRNLFSQIIAQKYQQQKDTYKAALAFGAADLVIFSSGKSGSTEYRTYNNSFGLDFIRNEMNTDQLMKLYGLFNGNKLSSFESYLVSHASFSKYHLVEVMGTSYLRDFNFPKAIEWLKKSNNTQSLDNDIYNYTTEKDEHVNVNPFHDYINDWSRYEKSLAKPYTKLSLAQKLLELQKSIDTAKSNESKAKIYYQLATAFYNMSYYGNCWMAMTNDRTSTEWYKGNYSTNWEREYYGVFKASEYYKKAYEISSNKEFKAAAFFLLAKCVQRQIPRLGYGDGDSDFDRRFRNNKLFPQFRKEFGDTKFYKYASNRCSYLRDFVK